VRIEKTVTVKAPILRAWETLLDPVAVGACVPGVERIEPIDATRFVVLVGVKVGIVRARFKVNVTVTETRPPHYLRSEGVGDEAGLTSSLRQTTELELKEAGPNETEIRVRTDVEVFGVLGSFGYSVIKGKADRMWEEFAANLKTRIE
jgi:carbon monoxide dehydrogenase subunit G